MYPSTFFINWKTLAFILQKVYFFIDIFIFSGIFVGEYFTECMT